MNEFEAFEGFPVECPLCGKPSIDGREHKECMDYEGMLAEIGISDWCVEEP